MKRVLYVTMARNDNKPANTILPILDSIKAHGFHVTETGAYTGYSFSVICEWRCIAPNRTRFCRAPVISLNREAALVALALDLGQDIKWLDFAEVEEDEEIAEAA